MVKKIENIDHQGKWNRYLFAIKTTAFYACRSCDMRPPPSGCRCCGDTLMKAAISYRGQIPQLLWV